MQCSFNLPYTLPCQYIFEALNEVNLKENRIQLLYIIKVRDSEYFIQNYRYRRPLVPLLRVKKLHLQFSMVK